MDSTPIPIATTTARQDAPPQMKSARFSCRQLREWVKRQMCAGCRGPGGDPHHFPTVGAGGDDLGIIPACRKCHDLMQQYKPPYTRHWQTQQQAETLKKFIRSANADERKAFLRSWEAYAVTRIYGDLW